MNARNLFRKGNCFLWDMDGIVPRGSKDIKRCYNKRSRLILKRKLIKEKININK